MPEFVRVRDNGTKHEYTVVASAVDPEAQTVLPKEPAVDEIGAPLPPKHHEKPGQPATDKKES